MEDGKGRRIEEGGWKREEDGEEDGGFKREED